MLEHDAVEQTKKLPEYEKPPLIEVACGLSFTKLEKFKLPYYGLYWESIQEEFSRCEHANPLGETTEPYGDGNYFLPRVWFFNETGDNLIQLQTNTFHFNWRKLQTQKEYPRYSTIIKKYNHHLSCFIEFLNKHKLGEIEPVKCHLTYVNHIFQGEGRDTIEDIGAILKNFSSDGSEKSFLPSPEGVAGALNYKLPNNQGSLSVKFRQARQIPSDNKPLIVIEFYVQGMPKETKIEAIWQWYELAHEWIVRGFSDITTNKAQIELWQRI